VARSRRARLSAPPLKFGTLCLSMYLSIFKSPIERAPPPYDILRDAGRPLHISEIVTRVAKRHGLALDRESIVSALAKRVARKDRFLRTGPTTFSILPETER
jgi:hypothetical protein